uniref:Uncharacterized protein n=1 Tax=Anguilla anguilla TaxID=7936 RepID=A0A0E9VKU6_ANGAN
MVPVASLSSVEKLVMQHCRDRQ